MLKSSDYGKYMKLFFKIMDIPDERKEVTETLVKKGRIEIAVDGSVKLEIIENVSKSIFSF